MSTAQGLFDGHDEQVTQACAHTLHAMLAQQVPRYSKGEAMHAWARLHQSMCQTIMADHSSPWVSVNLSEAVVLRSPQGTCQQM